MFGTKVLEERKSKFNGNLKVVRALGLGTYIQVDNLTQSGGIVESIWKSTIKKIKNNNFKNCLILGLGGGTVAKIIQKTWLDIKITGIDIDPVIVELGKKHLGLKNIEIKIEDAYNFNLKNYDLVIVDLYNGDKFPKKFKSAEFLKKLTKNKLVIFNRLYQRSWPRPSYYGDKKNEALEFGEKLKGIFSSVEYFYPITNIMFICLS